MIKTDLPLGGSGGGGAGTVTTTPAGGGTPGQIAKFTGPLTIGDSIINETGATISIAGSLTLGSALTPSNGGTGISSYTIGDLLYASGATTLSKLIDVAAGSYLRSGGVATAPLWSTTTLPNSATTGDILYASAANTYSNLADVATGQVLISGGVGVAPAYSANPTVSTITLTQGTIVADAPQINGTVTWNNAGIVGPAWKLNVTATSANANALLMDLQVGGASKFKLDRVGNITLAVAQLYLTGASSWSLDTSVFFGATTQAGSRMAASSGSGFVVMSTYSYGFSSTGAANGTIDLEVRREAANYHAWRNGTNAQRGSIFNTYTSSTNNEGATQDWQTTANLFRLYTFKGSGGGTARGMALGTDSVNRITIDALGNVALNGEQAALATNATDGFTYVPTCAGTPTGVPTAKTGAVALVFDTTNDKLWIYNGAWKQPKTPAGAAIVTWQ